MKYKVGVIYLLNERRRKFSYKDVVYDDEGFADQKIFLPIDFDLMTVKTNLGRIFSAWHTGHAWEGLRMKRKEKVLFWKRREEEEI